jgi:hypothetical protein
LISLQLVLDSLLLSSTPPVHAPNFAQVFVGGTAMTHVNAGDNMNAPKAILSAVYEGTQVPMDTAIRIESKYFAKVVADPQAGNMIRSLFVSKQAAEKGARRPKGIAPMPTKKIGMLGAGLKSGTVRFPDLYVPAVDPADMGRVAAGIFASADPAKTKA